MNLITKMPSVLLPHVIAEQERIEREIQAKRRAEQDNEENRVIDWLIEALTDKGEEVSKKREDYECRTFADHSNYIRDMHEISAWVWNYFGIHDAVLDAWKYDESNGDIPLDIVYKRDDGSYMLLQECGETYPHWKSECEEFFKNNSDRCFIVLRTG